MSDRTYTNLKVKIMDPQQCLYELLQAINEEDRDRALELLEALQGWIKRDGVLPTVVKASCLMFAEDDKTKVIPVGPYSIYQVVPGRNYLEEYNKGKAGSG